MDFLNKYILIGKHSFDSDDEYFAFKEVDAQDKRMLLKLISISGIFSCLIYAVFQIIPTFSIEAYSSILSAFVLFGVYLSTSYTKKYKISAIVISAIVSVFYLLYIYYKGVGGYDSFWLLIIPTVTISLLGLYYGVILSGSLFLLTIILLLINPLSIKTGIIVGLFFFSYISIMLIIAAYEWLRITSRRQEVIAKIKHANEEKAHKQKIDLLFQLSHQIRTPLNSIMGITSLMKQEELTLDQQEYVDAINTSVMNLSLAMSSMLNVTDIDSESKYQQHILFFNVSDILRHIVKSFCAQQICKITIDISSFIPTKLTGNAKKIEQVLENIFESIILHSPKDDAIIDVCVNNKKETASAVELLFEIHTSTIKSSSIEEKIQSNDNEEGTNFADLVELLDLSESKQIVNSFGGNLIHRKKDTSIDVFEFTIVLWKSQVPDMHMESSAPSISLNKAKELSEASVLIVEDNLMNQKVLSLSLETMVKSIEIANNGKEALKLFESSRFDIILMDIQMPILDGYKTTAKIRVSEIGTNFHVPIIALTANVMNGEMEKCLAFGMDDYLSKPFQMETLVEKMQFYLGKNRNS
jgi:CheY-like chemotaxis protein/signal transduction histidine kinase